MFAWLLNDPLPAGASAPDFSLPDQDGKLVSLAALKGRPVVLVFYPGDDTPGCTRQLCQMRDSYATLQSRGLAVFGVNPGGGESHRRFIEKYSLPFPLLIDKGGAVARLYHAGGWIVRRTVYAIDAAGVIRFARRGAPPPQTVLAGL